MYGRGLQAASIASQLSARLRENLIDKKLTMDSDRALGLLKTLLEVPSSSSPERLLEILHRLVDAGNSVIVIEHNLDVIRSSDHVIDLGPEGGDGGGEIVATGAPEDIARVEESHTGRFLRDLLPEAVAAS